MHAKNVLPSAVGKPPLTGHTTSEPVSGLSRIPRLRARLFWTSTSRRSHFVKSRHDRSMCTRGWLIVPARDQLQRSRSSITHRAGAETSTTRAFSDPLACATGSAVLPVLFGCPSTFSTWRERSRRLQARSRIQRRRRPQERM